MGRADETKLGEGDRDTRFAAAERIKRLPGDRHVSVSVSDGHHSLEPWILEIGATEAVHQEEGADYLWAFCPLHQRPTSSLGSVGVEVGNVVVGFNCPGILKGIYHPGGYDMAEAWVLDHPVRVAELFEREGKRIQTEVANNDLATAPGVTMPVTGEVKAAVFAHLEQEVATLKKFAKRIQAGDVPQPGKV